MESEALKNLRTMRHVRTLGDIIHTRSARTTNSLSKTEGETEVPALLNDRWLSHVLQQEERRFSAFEKTITRSQQRMLRSREKLAAAISRNRALMTLRYDMQRARSNGNKTQPSVADAPPSRRSLRQIELNY